MSEHFDFDAARFMWVRRGVGAEETRYYLTGVRVEPRPEGGAMLVATDGRVLFCAVDPSAECPRAATISLEVCDPWPDHVPDFDDCDPEEDVARRVQDWSALRLRFDIGPEEDATAVAAFEDPNSRHWFRQGVARNVGGKYPDWRVVLNRPDDRKPGLPILKPELITRAAYQGRGVLIVPRGGGHIVLGEKVKGEASVIVPAGAPWGFVVIMPMGFNYAKVVPGDALVREMINAADLAAIMGEPAP